MRLGKKNSTNLGQFDYLQDLNILLFSNVVDQAAQKTEYYLAYYMGGDKQATSSSRHSHGIICLRYIGFIFLYKFLG
jgi:hypothetical protein